jgi:hypothetical protein
MFRQFDLRSDDHRLTCWLPETAGLRVGALVTLRDHAEPDRHWEVVRMSATRLPAPPHQPWRVGGLL